MSSLFQFFRDPIFGIAILVAIIAFIALTTYFWNLHAKRKQRDSIGNFMKLFEGISVDEVAKETLQKLGHSLPALEFLAQSYARMGDYEHSISLYKAMLECDIDNSEKLMIMQSLAEVYYFAGFLERAKKILLEVLKHNPRNPKALHILLCTFETLQLYDEALDALVCLRQLGLDTSMLTFNTNYLQAQKELHKDAPSIDILLRLIRESPQLFVFIMRKIKDVDVSAFWNAYREFGRGTEIIDLLWDMNPPDIVKNDDVLNEINRAKYGGMKPCTVFELEILRCLHIQGSQKAYLTFTYQCRHCAEDYPIYIERCVHCRELLAQKLKLSVKNQGLEYENCPAVL